MARLGSALVFFVLLFSIPQAAYAQTAPPAVAAPQLTVEEMKNFLKTARVVRSRQTNKGVTAPKRLTLSNGTLTHDAVFQSVDDRQMVANLSGGGRSATTEMNFVDSYRYNLAAYALAGLLGLEHMMPVHVERRWNGQIGSLSWFMASQMDESERLKKKVQPPNATEWNYQMYRMRVFTALVRDTDRNLTNVLITPEWKVIMIDFSRAFRLQPELMYSKDLARIDRNLLPALEALTKDSVKAATGDWLTGAELDAMLKRRDLLVAHFRKLIADLGEEKVLY
jgi:hypothetical protein